MRTGLLAAGVLVWLNGCALMAASLLAGGGGDATERLGPDTFMVAVGGGAFNHHVDEELLYRCADAVDRAGFDSFTVTSRHGSPNAQIGLLFSTRTVAYLRAFKGPPPNGEASYWAKEILKQLVAYR